MIQWVQVTPSVLSSRSGAIHIGQPNKLTVIFGRKVTKQYRGKLQTVIEDLDLPNPVIATTTMVL